MPLRNSERKTSWSSFDRTPKAREIYAETGIRPCRPFSRAPADPRVMFSSRIFAKSATPQNGKQIKDDGNGAHPDALAAAVKRIREQFSKHAFESVTSPRKFHAGFIRLRGAVHNRGLVCMKNILIKTASHFVSPAYYLLFFIMFEGEKVLFLLMLFWPLKSGFKKCVMSSSLNIFQETVS